MSQVHPGQSTQFVILLEARKRLESVRPYAHSLTCRLQGQPEDLLDASHTTSTRLLSLNLPGRVGSSFVFCSGAARLSLSVHIWGTRFHLVCRRWLHSSASRPLSLACRLGSWCWALCWFARVPLRVGSLSLLSVLGCPPPLSLSSSFLGCCGPPLHACGLFIPACPRLNTGLAHCRPSPPSTHGAHMTLL